MQQPTLKVRQIVSGKNHRERFDPAKMKDLEEGIKAAGGVIEPIIVRPLDDGTFEIIAGERRWRAARNLYGDDYDMPVVIREATDAEARALGIIENHHREDTSDIEQAQGAAELLAYNKGDKQETALQLGWNVDTLERRLLLLNCAQVVRTALNDKRIKLGHAELLAGLPKDKQERVLAGVLEHKVPVEVLKKQLGQFAKRLADAIFDTAQCTGCTHNSAQQAALFDESVGEGFCQNPAHFDELTLAALDLRAVPLRERFQVVKIVRAQDGFIPLHVRADGDLGVGSEQYVACRGCASFGCSLSAVPGSYGEQLESLCFDAACNSRMVAARRKSEREAATKVAAGAGKARDAKGAVAAPKPAPRSINQTPPRVVEFRVACWRRWVANRLMSDGARNHRVLAALIAASHASAINSGKFVDAAAKLAAPAKIGANTFKSALEQTDAIAADKLAAVVHAITASAAFGIDQATLDTVLNYLEVDEAAHFTLNEEYLDLLTISELESLADELKLKRAMGDGFKKARSGKKADFIKALLTVAGVEYRGLVPKAMRYPRRAFRYAAVEATPAPAPAEHGDEVAAATA
jgi:PRTRC genetic system ParB family protein